MRSTKYARRFVIDREFRELPLFSKLAIANNLAVESLAIIYSTEHRARSLRLFVAALLIRGGQRILLSLVRGQHPGPPGEHFDTVRAT